MRKISMETSGTIKYSGGPKSKDNICYAISARITLRLKIGAKEEMVKSESLEISAGVSIEKNGIINIDRTNESKTNQLINGEKSSTVTDFSVDYDLVISGSTISVFFKNASYKLKENNKWHTIKTQKTIPIFHPFSPVEKEDCT